MRVAALLESDSVIHSFHAEVPVWAAGGAPFEDQRPGGAIKLVLGGAAYRGGRLWPSSISPGRPLRRQPEAG